MATNTRAYGANARQLDWDDSSQDSGRTGSWMPLDGLDDEMYTAHRLHAVASVAAPAMPQPRRVAPSLPWRRDETARPAPTREMERATAQAPARQEKVVEARSVMMIAGAAVMVVVLYAVVSAAVQWTQVKLDDLQYGRPRTMQLDAYVGHNEADGVPSHFVAMNLNRRVTIIEMPGGDSAKISTILGPYLFGQGEDLTPITLSSTDLNGDGLADLSVNVKNEQLLYLNDGSAFHLASTEERLAIQKAQAQAQQQPALADSAQTINGDTTK
ncbi:MAG TPA: hypothetical protein VLQ48_11915 [Chloroflexia bacterium]|nr:hypothetical protein [Chloroflexia bacterium]